ncbi:MAG: Uma2 family endonuclease [Candidatus Flexifilum sp.]
MALSIRSTPALTLDDFQAYASLPENADRRLELIAGEIIDVPSNPFASRIALLIGFFLQLFLQQRGIAGHVLGPDAGQIIDGHLLAPDVSLISSARLPVLPKRGFSSVPPELAVEVISDPANTVEQRTLRRKLTIYLSAGCVVWIVDPFARTVEVYAPGQPGLVLDETGTLTLETVLPGFALPVRDIFPADAGASADAGDPADAGA